MIDWSLEISEIAAAIREPVASVAMNESMRAPTTTMALSSPIRKPARTVRRIAGTTPTPSLTNSQATMMLHKPIALPTERSKIRAESGHDEAR